jgi:cytochrome c oxidase subunit I+III
VSPQVCPSAQALPGLSWPAASAALLVVSGVMLAVARHRLGGQTASIAGLIIAGVIALIAALGVDIWSQWQSGLRADASAYGAIVYTSSVLQSEIVVPVFIMAGFALARLLTGRLDAVRRAVFDNLALLWGYAIGQGLVGLLLTHGFPRLVSQ